jgi:hypothetical protein
MNTQVDEVMEEDFPGIVIPPDVTNRRAYLQMLQYKREYENAFEEIQTSDPDLVVKAQTSPGALQKQIKDLPADEQEMIMGKNNRVLQLRGKWVGLQHVAYSRVIGK